MLKLKKKPVQDIASCDSDGRQIRAAPFFDPSSWPTSRHSKTQERFVKVDPRGKPTVCVVHCAPQLTKNQHPGRLQRPFQPTKTGGLRTDFYPAHQKEAAEYDTYFVKQYDGDLNTTLISVSLPLSTPRITPDYGGSLNRYHHPVGFFPR